MLCNNNNENILTDWEHVLMPFIYKAWNLCTYMCF